MTTTTDPVQFTLSAQERKAIVEDVAREACREIGSAGTRTTQRR